MLPLFLEEQFATRPQKVLQQPIAERIGGRGNTRRKSQRLTAFKLRSNNSSRQIAQSSSKNMSDIIDICSSTEEMGTCESTSDYLKSPTDSQNTQVSSSHNTSSPAQILSVGAACHSPKEFQAKVIPEDFDKLLNSMDDFLSQPLPIASVLPPATDHSVTVQEEMAKARKKLSLFLALDNPVILSSTKLSELSFLSSKLKKDPSLSSEQHSMLQLIDEIPFGSKEFREAKKVADEADKFFADLKSNIDLATTLKNDYNESKGKEALLEAEVNCSSLEIEKIDKQIAKLQAQRAALGSAAEKKKREMVKLSSTQKKVAECLPKVVYEVQLANSKSPEWELKMKNSAMLKDNIFCKFAPLKGFSL